MKNNEYKVLSEDAIKYLCGLIRDLASVSEGIDNINLADDKTFSNIYIKNLIDKCLEDANAEAEKLVGALTHLTCEETVIQPTLDNSEINVIYLYSADGNPPYQQFLKISEDKLVDLGSTSILLEDYIKAADVAKDYATKVELKAVTDKIGTTTLTTTDTTITGAIEEVKRIVEGKAEILDSEKNDVNTWSSNKIASEITGVETELNANLGEKVDYKVVVEDGTRYVEDVVTQDINTWLPNDNSSILINLKKSNDISYLNFQLLCNKKDSKNWSCIVNGAANELWKIRYIDGVRYIDELATMDKVNALHKETTGYITGSLLGSVVKNANLYYQKFGDNRLVINGWVSIDAVSAKTPIFTLPNDWKANSNYLLPCYVDNSNVACACKVDLVEGTVYAYTPLPSTLELRFCGEIYLI